MLSWREQETNCKGKVDIFTVQSWIFYQYPVDLLNIGTLIKTSKYFKMGEILTCWRHLSHQFCPGVEHLKVKKFVM